MIIGRRVYQIRTLKQLTQKTFAAHTGVSRSYVSEVEAGKVKPSIQMLRGICQCYEDISLRWLLTGEGEILKPRAQQGWDQRFVSVRRYDVSASAGPGLDVLTENELMPIPFPVEWLSQNGLAAEQAAIIHVTGDSMSPVLNDGDLVLIDTQVEHVISGKCYVIRIDNELLVKYLQNLPGNEIQISSENHKAYPPFTAAVDDMGFQVIGRVIASNHRWA